MSTDKNIKSKVFVNNCPNDTCEINTYEINLEPNLEDKDLECLQSKLITYKKKKFPKINMNIDGNVLPVNNPGFLTSDVLSGKDDLSLIVFKIGKEITSNLIDKFNSGLSDFINNNKEKIYNPPKQNLIIYLNIIEDKDKIADKILNSALEDYGIHNIMFMFNRDISLENLLFGNKNKHNYSFNKHHDILKNVNTLRVYCETEDILKINRIVSSKKDIVSQQKIELYHLYMSNEKYFQCIINFPDGVTCVNDTNALGIDTKFFGHELKDSSLKFKIAVDQTCKFFITFDKPIENKIDIFIDNIKLNIIYGQYECQSKIDHCKMLEEALIFKYKKLKNNNDCKLSDESKLFLGNVILFDSIIMNNDCGFTSYLLKNLRYSYNTSIRVVPFKRATSIGVFDEDNTLYDGFKPSLQRNTAW